MAVAYNRQELKIRDTTVLASVPENDTARLMHYLDSMCTVLQLEVTDYSIQRLKDYKKYYLLTRDEQENLIGLCFLVSPDKLEGSCIFRSDEICNTGFGNRFFRIDSTETGFVASQSVFVGTVQVSVKEFMVYKNSWMNEHYRAPMNRLTRVVKNTTKNNDEWIYTSTSESLDCCVIQ
ncbi:unnamed protein product [Mytilus coruscus]|uniref:Uncharacterized protein n=1 Tax=Mytilus coruscus TaxID=42192 RepID=A0A6J7ZSX8_MYTCO|nr:unnamed protein product [Mytilus coruscus]